MRTLAVFAMALATTAAALAQTPKHPHAAIHHQVSSIPAAQAAFDRGLLDYYAYNPEAAEHEFYTAADLDKHSAMAWWGIAISNAPNLNVPATDDRNHQATVAIKKAKALEASATPEDAAFIDAFAARFNGDPKAKSGVQLAAYRDALQQIAQAYPNDPDAAALFAEAALYVAAGDLRATYGKRSVADQAAFTASMAALLPYYQTELAMFPQHVGLLHFYIHAAQMAADSKVAVDAARKLAAFSFPPEDSHLTHMPGHTFFDVGMYDEALDVGERSVAMDAADVACCHPGYYSAVRYYHNHNVSFVLYALTQTGHPHEAIAVARNENVTFLAYQLVAAGQWQDVVALPYGKGAAPGATYARALAYARLGDDAKANATIAGLSETDETPFDRAMSRAMKLTIAGEIALVKGDDASALTSLTGASAALSGAQAIETSEIPPLYFYSPHMALARLATQMGKLDLARQALAAELVASPRSSTAMAAFENLR